MERKSIDYKCETTCDQLFSADIKCLQHKVGYRFSVDAVLVAQFCRPRPEEIVLDLCCGCGVISLIMLYRFGDRVKQISMLDKQPGLINLAKQNIALNFPTVDAEFMEVDLKNIANSCEFSKFGMVVCNPPFYLEKASRANLNQESYHARHQVDLHILDIIKAAKYVLKDKGRLIIIYPAEYAVDLFCALRETKLEPKRMQFVYGYPHHSKPAKLILVEAVLYGGVGMEVISPFYIHKDKSGKLSLEMQDLYNENSICSAIKMPRLQNTVNCNCLEISEDFECFRCER